ncbi:hypothetical protein GCM10009602_16360 [Nocardiopsis tropica]
MFACAHTPPSGRDGHPPAPSGGRRVRGPPDADNGWGTGDPGPLPGRGRDPPRPGPGGTAGGPRSPGPERSAAYREVEPGERAPACE